VVLPLPIPGMDFIPGDGTVSSTLLSDSMADSITAVRLAAAINAEFGRGGGDPLRVRPSALLEPAATLERICTHIIARETDTVQINWRLESALDVSLQYIPAANLVQEPDHTGPQHVLLTGASGFLGAFVLAELLNSSPCRVSCLIRATSSENARARLCSTLHQYGLLESQSTVSAFAQRVSVIAGDIALENLGISEQARAQLLARHSDVTCTPIDAIVHCAARVSSVAPYAALRGTNVDGTSRLLQLAAERCASLHFRLSHSFLHTNLKSPCAEQARWLRVLLSRQHNWSGAVHGG